MKVGHAPRPIREPAAGSAGDAADNRSCPEITQKVLKKKYSYREVNEVRDRTTESRERVASGFLCARVISKSDKTQKLIPVFLIFRHKQRQHANQGVIESFRE